VIEDDVHVREALGQHAHVGQADRAGLDAHRQTQLGEHFPGREGRGIVEFAGVEVLGRTAREDAQAREALVDPGR
jgi:hypothetical protein